MLLLKTLNDLPQVNLLTPPGYNFFAQACLTTKTLFFSFTVHTSILLQRCYYYYYHYDYYCDFPTKIIKASWNILIIGRMLTSPPMIMVTFLTSDVLLGLMFLSLVLCQDSVTTS